MKTPEILELAKKAGWVNVSSTEVKIRLKKDDKLAVIYTSGYGSSCSITTPAGTKVHKNITRAKVSLALGVPNPVKKVAPKVETTVPKKAPAKKAAPKKAAPKKTTKKTTKKKK